MAGKRPEDTSNQADAASDSATSQGDANEGRRKLLRAAIYVAPAVIGTLVTKRVQAAGQPCTPLQPPPNCSCAPSKLLDPRCP